MFTATKIQRKMPELPEVETTLRGIQSSLQQRRIAEVIVREPRFRWPVSPDLPARVQGRMVEALERRAKYILIRLDRGWLVCHLGMSGSMRIVDSTAPPRTHDHIDLVLDSGSCLRFNDPRRFGCFLWCDDPREHPLLANLGPEPLGDRFDGDYLYQRARGRRQAVKAFIMDQSTVVGVGNIYASEALFKAGIAPSRPAGRVSRQRYRRLANEIRAVLSAAIEQGGTTLRDFSGADGKPGYFRQQLAVYDRLGQPCPACARPIRKRVIGQRASYYCPGCQR